MRAFTLLLSTISITGCSSILVSPAADACGMLAEDEVGQALGSDVTAMVLQKGINNGRLTASSCRIELEDGLTIRLAVEDYSELKYMHQMRDGFEKWNPRTKDAALSSELGFASYFDAASQRLEVDLGDGKFLYVHPADRARPSVRRSGKTTTFDFRAGEMLGAREKLSRLAKLVSW